jgi:hypothetical protein
MSFMPEADREYLASKNITYVELDQGGQKAIVFSKWPLPPLRYDSDYTDVLVMLPSGYPDVSPDMFYTLPWIKLMPENRPPIKADVSFDFDGKSWQRWSRHNNEWRPGKDGIWTMIQRIKTAIEVATA